MVVSFVKNPFLQIIFSLISGKRAFPEYREAHPARSLGVLGLPDGQCPAGWKPAGSVRRESIGTWGAGWEKGASVHLEPRSLLGEEGPEPQSFPLRVKMPNAVRCAGWSSATSDQEKA